MASQKNLDLAYLRCALAISQLSVAKRKKVGAIMVSSTGHGIIAEGFNGTLNNFDNICEDIISLKKIKSVGFLDEPDEYNYQEELVTKKEVVHAEMNCVLKVAKSNNSSQNSILYVTASPCFECGKLIIQSGIKRVVYIEFYKNADGIDLLKKAGIEVLQYNEVV